jgi:hypothetical protein
MDKKQLSSLYMYVYIHTMIVLSPMFPTVMINCNFMQLIIIIIIPILSLSPAAPQVLTVVLWFPDALKSRYKTKVAPGTHPGA